MIQAEKKPSHSGGKAITKSLTYNSIIAQMQVKSNNNIIPFPGVGRVPVPVEDYSPLSIFNENKNEEYPTFEDWEKEHFPEGCPFCKGKMTFQCFKRPDGVYNIPFMDCENGHDKTNYVSGWGFPPKEFFFVSTPVPGYNPGGNPGSKKENPGYNSNGSWITNLRYNNSGYTNIHYNINMILENDPKIQGIAFNENSGCIEVTGELPWRKKLGQWKDEDDSDLMIYLSEVYPGISSKSTMIDCLLSVTGKRRFHPIRDFLDSLPEWDGVERVDSLLVDYLNAEDCRYTRAVTRITLCGAVARIYQPGIKFDTMLVPVGMQGLYKSTLFRKLCYKEEWFIDTVKMQDMRDKTAPEKVLGYWIVEIAELAGMRKAEVEDIKSFISTQADKFRMPYARRVEAHPRQNILVGTTNAQHGFLRDTTGNRRFLPVECKEGAKKSVWDDLTPDEVKQVWAEAKKLWNGGEKLYLSKELEADAQDRQTAQLEHDDRVNEIENWLDDNKKDKTCLKEIWHEVFHNPSQNMDTRSQNDLRGVMSKVKGWKRYDGNKDGLLRIDGYGKQRSYIKIGSEWDKGTG